MTIPELKCKALHCVNNSSGECSLSTEFPELDEMGICPEFDRGNLGIEKDIDKNILFDKCQSLLIKARESKQKHRNSTQCSRSYESCGGCHFWSGSIATLTDLLNMPSSID